MGLVEDVWAVPFVIACKEEEEGGMKCRPGSVVVLHLVVQWVGCCHFPPGTAVQSLKQCIYGCIKRS